MFHETCYVSCNCNQVPTAAHWGKNNLICYAACNSVMIYDPNWGSGGKIIATLVGHSKRVNSVRWLISDSGETGLVSGSSDHTAIVWSWNGQKYIPFVLKGHSSIVNIVDGLYKGDKVVVVTVSMDSTVRIWSKQHQSDEFSNVQVINCGYSICVGVRISFLSSSKLILACALDNSRIELYTEEEQFNHSATLQGHEDWVRGLDFTIDDKGDLILASSSQDCYIRLWRITHNLQQNNIDNTSETKLGNFSVYVDSILTGHEGWVYSVNWSPKSLQLLSASLDKSMVIWELDSESKLWLEKIRVGEVGGNTLGFYGGIFSPDGEKILAHGYHGAFHIWENKGGCWEPAVTVGGHFGEVTDLAWDPEGEYLMSVSSDQTTRIHAPWSRNEQAVTWHEIARPQVHGYDLSSMAILSRYRFASSAEEKVIRMFEAPGNFVENFSRICNLNLEENEDGRKAEGASVPSLGLSNKAVFMNDNKTSSEDSHFTAVILTEPPTEETLLQNTLWPEVQKLYGHGYEVYSLASSPDGLFLASACKATTSEHAAILLWDTVNWKIVQKLFSHTLTVAQMAFSPDSLHLLSVSRDRRWSLFSKNGENEFQLAATTDKKTSVHSRIIWACCWSHDSKYFATGSRDGKVVVWTKNEKKEKRDVLGQYEAASNYLELKNESVTAVAFPPDFVLGFYLLALGLESGIMRCYKWSLAEWQPVLSLDKNIAHHLTVRKLAFRPVFGLAGRDNDVNILQLASCGSDTLVLIHNIVIK